VPTLFHGPGFTGTGSFDGLVSLIDLPPTLLDAAGLPVPEGMQGRSILPRRIKDDAAEDDIFVQVSEDHVGRALRTRRWKYEVTAPDADGWNSKDSQRYVETHLYDLDADPYELDDLAGRPGYDAVRAQLRERLMQRIVAVGESRPEIVRAATL
jgi:arylsulfatase A-like enzyme